MELSRSVVPPGGYWYEEELGEGGKTRIEGGSYEDLLSRILEWRQNNGNLLRAGVTATPDGVWEDYHRWGCRQWPWLCTGVREGPVTTVEKSGTGVGAAGFEMLIFRMQRWVDGLKRTALDWVDQKRARDRGEICLGCVQNVVWETNCGSCNSTLVQGGASVLGARRTGLEAGLRGCRAFGTKLDLAIWLDNPGGDNKYPAPEGCWRVRGL